MLMMTSLLALLLRLTCIVINNDPNQSKLFYVITVLKPKRIVQKEAI